MESQERKTAGTSSPTTVSTQLQRIAMLAKQAPGMGFRATPFKVDGGCFF
jgi:hypothetical protein